MFSLFFWPLLMGGDKKHMKTKEEEYVSTSVILSSRGIQEGIVSHLSLASIPAPPHPQRGLEGVCRREDCVDGARRLYV